MKTITSRQNQLIKEIAALATAKERKKQQRFLAEGLRTVSTIAQHNAPEILFCTQETIHDAKRIADEERIIVVPESVMQKISPSTSAPGMIGVFAIPPAPSTPLSAGIVLAQVTNPGNMGTLIRTAAAMGINTVVVVEGTDPWHPKVIQASAGTIAAVHIYQLTWDQLLAKKGALSLCALVVSGGKDPSELPLANTLLVVGNEAHGLPAAWQADCTQRCTLAMPGNTESLNAAVAGAITLYLLAQAQTSPI